MVTVKFYSLLRLQVKKSAVGVEIVDGTIRDLLERARTQTGCDFLPSLVDIAGVLIPGTIILLNGRNILLLENHDTRVRDGDEVALFPPAGGG
jgi:molybdopterin synthase sulfur carrier subunit